MASDPCLDFNWEAFLEQDFNATFDIQLPNDGSNCDLFDVEHILASDAFALSGDFPDAHLQPIAAEQRIDDSERDPKAETSATREGSLNHAPPAPNQSWGTSSVNDVEVSAAECLSVCYGQHATNVQKDETTAGSQPANWTADPLDLYIQINQLRKE